MRSRSALGGLAAVTLVLASCAPSAPPPRKVGAALDDLAKDGGTVAVMDASPTDAMEDTPVVDAAPPTPVVVVPPLPPMSEADVVVHHDLTIGAVDACVTPDVPLEGGGDVNEAIDVVYGTMGEQEQRLDVAWPKSIGPHPLVVIIHGGGWSAGTRELYRKDTRRLASIGYVAATIDYRLCSKAKNRFPAGIVDVRCAVRWLRAQANAYGIDRTRVVALGASAGGHLAAMLGVQADAQGLDGECPNMDQPVSVSGVAAYYPPLDVRTPKKTYQGIMIKGTEEFLGALPEEVPQLAALASPMAHVDAKDAPFLLLHGVDDTIIPIKESRRFLALLKKAKVPSYLLEVEGDKGTHGFPILVTTRPRVTCTTLAFIAAATK
ncbi:MAG: alpha/beta hydrolase [Polyangiales bacterium]